MVSPKSLTFKIKEKKILHLHAKKKKKNHKIAFIVTYSPYFCIPQNQVKQSVDFYSTDDGWSQLNEETDEAMHHIYFLLAGLYTCPY